MVSLEALADEHCCSKFASSNHYTRSLKTTANKKASRLTTEGFDFKDVGVTGFEPVTLCL